MARPPSPRSSRSARALDERRRPVARGRERFSCTSLLSSRRVVGPKASREAGVTGGCRAAQHRPVLLFAPRIHMSLLRILQATPQPQADLTVVYDAIVIGSGAAGGMAAHVLTSHGLQVLMLEAGKKLDIDKELKSMEWPYEHPRRGDMPPGHHPLSLNEYTIRKPPYAADSRNPKVYSYVQGWSGPDYSKHIVVDEKEHPYTGTNYAWVRARCLGGKTNIWGRLALRLSDYDFKAKSHDGYGDDWPLSYRDVAPYYDR